MRNLLNPKWILIINTLPIVILFLILYGEFQIIKSLLSEENITLWKTFGLTLGVLGLLNFGYATYLILKQQSISFYYAIFALLSHLPFIYLYAFHLQEIIPSSIPDWMIPGSMVIYVGTFLMPTLAYALFILVTHFTPVDQGLKAKKSFYMAIMIPIVWYVFAQVILPLWQPTESFFNIHVILILLIAGTLAFLFFLVRGILILATKKSVVWQKYQLYWKVPISIILPLTGLALNNGVLNDSLTMGEIGIFGNFSNHWFYIIALLNGIFICLPNREHKLYRILLFFGRCLTFAYTFYFFIVFLPFLPLSVIAIVAIGTGFLMLTPLVLFIVHINELANDFTFLRTYYTNSAIWIFSIVGFMTIPLIITNDYLNDRKTLHQTLDYLYSPDYSKKYHLDKASLQNTLAVIKKHKEKNNNDFFGSHQPYLSSYFNFLVLDNLTLSDAKINTIEKIFFGRTSLELRTENIQNDKVSISNISTNSVFDQSQNAWKSWVELEITNQNKDARWLSEYATTLDLPEGTWISDYYLYVGDKKEMGILAEKKSAMWVFSNIRSENRDPGILYYLTGNKVAFRVFPFSNNETRKTGFELIHKEPIQFTIDEHTVELGKPKTDQEHIVETDDMVYVSVQQKQELTKVYRKPYFHFILDISKEENISRFKKQIGFITEKYKSLTENAKISLVNSVVSTTSLDDNWEQQLQEENFGEGFYIDRAIKTTLFNSYKAQSDTYPVMVVVTDNLENAVFNKDLSDWQFAFPEGDIFYNLNESGELEPHSLTSNPYQSIRSNKPLSFSHPVLAYKLKDNSIRYIPDNQKASVILKSDLFEVQSADISEKDWTSALILQGKWISNTLHPETSSQEWLNLVKYSFTSKIMTPVTSYLVVENEAQKAILKKKQKQVLSGNRSLDLSEDTQRMSEPSLILLAVLLIFVIWYKQRRTATNE
ncbi:MSEP-CTERM sorting domain-containing protein [Limibacter armeniacum]|uniref:MSEP-CTERM sorting domain-containing protein n=1 Tax=Limibacter armeniacum TaxID=466084 RepID=UPI002FE69ABD